MIQIEIKRCNFTDDGWDTDSLERIDVNLSTELLTSIKRAYKLAQSDPAITNIDLTIDRYVSFFGRTLEEYINSVSPIGDLKIRVYKKAGVFLTIQGKYDCTTTAEYAFPFGFLQGVEG